jgi:hypothetical protein
MEPSPAKARDKGAGEGTHTLGRILLCARARWKAKSRSEVEREEGMVCESDGGARVRAREERERERERERLTEILIPNPYTRLHSFGLYGADFITVGEEQKGLSIGEDVRIPAFGFTPARLLDCALCGIGDIGRSIGDAGFTAVRFFGRASCVIGETGRVIGDAGQDPERCRPTIGDIGVIDIICFPGE